MRENNGEIELAKKNKLPNIIKYNDIKGDLHMHTNWSDGNYEIEEMIKKNFYYTSSVDGNDYNLTAENWPYHNFKGKKENYELRIKEAKTTLKEFGEAAMEAGDNKTYELVQNVLKTLETDEGKDDKVININDIRQAA